MQRPTLKRTTTSPPAEEACDTARSPPTQVMPDPTEKRSVSRLALHASSTEARCRFKVCVQVQGQCQRHVGGMAAASR